jgi:multidrug transporter EmrE-like cation transporter
MAQPQTFHYTAGVRSALLVVVYAAFVTAANVLMKLSAGASALWPSLLLMTAGNFIGFVGILTYTLLLRTLPLHVAFPLTRGAAVLGVQLAASLIVFHEALRPTEAAGAALVVAGIVLAGLGARRAGTEEEKSA